MRAILVRANFVPIVRHAIGWRGLRQSVATGGCWTAKISGFPGVFGLLFDGLDPAPGWLRGRFLLHYFPSPDEALVECCSLQAAAVTQVPEYLQHVGDFPSHPEFSRIFAIGCIRLAVDATEKALALDLESLSTQRTIAEDGVLVGRNGEMVPMIDPGGRDQDFPALEVASGLFNALAASATFNLGQPPAYVSERRFPATQIVYDGTGATRSIAAADLWKFRLLLGYGKGRFDDLDEADGDSSLPAVHTFRWRAGEPPPVDYPNRLWWRADQIHDGKTVDKKILGVDERPPLIILTGFLGSGKTSFLQHYIEYQTQRSCFVAVIENEIGEVGLDGKLLDYRVTEIDEGCVCCSLVGNLKRAFQGILETFSPDTIILETSGLANPKNLLDELGELDEWVRLDSTVTVVDALNFETSLEDYAIAADQITAADVLILNKSDLVGEERLPDLRHRLQQLNSHAPIVVSCRGDVNPATIFDVGLGLGPDRRRSLPPGPDDNRPPRHTHGDDHLRSRTIRLTQVLARQAFLKAVGSLPSSILRVKGIIELSDPREIVLFQYVAGRYDISAFADNRVRDRFLTFVGKTDEPNTFEAVEELIRAAEI
ncbi:MAG TPA: GTP-binding protein [Syntrophobacteria bacterium]|jgi:G3E family GTPase|nr:GTP-binding protein [Syntrophobacteria bacterium]